MRRAVWRTTRSHSACSCATTEITPFVCCTPPQVQRRSASCLVDCCRLHFLPAVLWPLNELNSRAVELVAGAVSTICGVSGVSGYRDGALSEAQFYRPRALAFEREGAGAGSGAGAAQSKPYSVLIVVDQFNHALRRIDLEQSTCVAPALTFPATQVTSDCCGCAVGLGSESVSTVAGGWLGPGFANGAGSEARFNMPLGVTCHASADGSSTVCYVADNESARIRKVLITPCTAQDSAATIASSASAAAAAAPAAASNPLASAPTAPAPASGSTSTAAAATSASSASTSDSKSAGSSSVGAAAARVIRACTTHSAVVSTLCGSGEHEHKDAAVGAEVELDTPRHVCVDPSGQALYVTCDNAIRKVDAKTGRTALLS
jgi:hypothetical protein